MTRVETLNNPADHRTGDCCAGEPCGCGPSLSLTRRGFLGVSAAALIGVALPTGAVAVPADKNLDPRWVAKILARGSATRWEGDALGRIGMPVGGAAAGQVYLSGDGRLWLWDILNDDSAFYGGADFAGGHYATPLSVTSPFATGFAIRSTKHGGSAVTATLDANGFPQTSFAGRYPIGSVAFRGGRMEADVDLDVFSPFVPTNLADSELPATILEYTVRNTARTSVEYELLGFAENPVCLHSRAQQPITLSSQGIRPAGGAGLQFAATASPVDDPTGDDILFQDWSGAGLGDWTATGDAFGAGPVNEADLPSGMLRFGSLGTATGRFVTSYNFRGTGSTGADDYIGSLRSPDFTVSRNGIMTRVGGGYGTGLQIRVLVDGAVVASATGLRYEPLRPVYLDVSGHRGKTAHIEIIDSQKGFWGHLNCDRIVFTDRDAPKPDLVFEDWASGTYDKWTVAGTAFGATPVTEAQTPDYFRREGPLMLLGNYFATSHDFRGHPGDAAAADTAIGTLTSRPFTIDHRYLVANIGGGSDTSQLGLRVIVDGTVVARLAGNNAETLGIKAADLGPWLGKAAHLEIVDAATGGWGHLNCDRIWFSELPVRVQPFAELRDAGTFALVAYDHNAEVRPSLQRHTSTADWFDSPAAATISTDNTQAGAVSVHFGLLPGQTRKVRFALGWNFQRLSLAKFSFVDGAANLRHHYATRFHDASAVLGHIGGDNLSAVTHTFVDTWYRDTTLPHWFVERTFAPASTLSTETCQYFDTGRFYAWEGAYCCAGTCTHVWNYAQSVAYLFPELERSARTMADYGVSFHPDTGAIDYRGEAGMIVAHDGQCGNILRTYREHQMSTSTAFLTGIWPRVKKAMQYLIGHDGTPPNGIFETDQYNTLDATWYGEIPWISGLYVAALHAAAEMALDMGDNDFARQCRTIAASGSDYLDDMLWNSKYHYFEQKVDPKHADATNSNRGCYIDQMFGQTYTHQLGLAPVFDTKKADIALKSLYRNNFLPDARAYMGKSGIDGGRIFSTDGEAGTLMCSWPFGGADEAPGAGASSSVAYFNEVWTGTEWQFAAHLLHAGQVDEGMAVARAIYDRYSATKRNPYNEIECSDHYARSMMSHAAYLAALGFEHHGPRGHLGFAPKLAPNNFRAGFTVGAGWGSYAQQRHGAALQAQIELRYGHLDGLVTLALEVLGTIRHVEATRSRGTKHQDLTVKTWHVNGSRLLISFAAPVKLAAGDTLRVSTK